MEEAIRSGGPVLEIGCGTGRVLLPTARAGVTITGLDRSPSMLDVCRNRLGGEPAAVRDRVDLSNQDMRDFRLSARFSLATMPFRPFLHLLTPEDQLACLACVHRHLQPHGALVLDLFNPSLYALVDEKRREESEDGPAFALPDGRRVQRTLRVRDVDLFRQVQDIEMTYYVSHPGGRSEVVVHRFKMRYVFRFEAEHLLARSGFDVEALFADHARQPVGSSYPGELVFVARRGS